MSEILYLKFGKNTRTYNQTITLGEAGEMQCADSAIVNRLKTEKLYTFQNVKKGKHSCAARRVFSILEVVEKIQGVYPNLEIQNMGEQDFIVEYSTKPKEQPALTFLKVAVVCLICFFGSAFSIMAFNNDVSTVDMFGQFYMLMTGQESDGFTILELTYSLGLAAGIIAFFNHIGGRRLTKEPTPIEVEMRLYEDDVNTTLINTASRNGMHKKEQ
ncbi:MAG: stage V sporulation protein AA [Lachnospiraceae bacterium]|jgi:stage V sporulation protein AA|uniref:stage V sporulation protein AA n=1 Tax=Candidatus Merdisoma sp. JLR.KK006 TaxID=3112626 RepID=UPI002FF35DC3|nr:stage V sporulation protein AA [Lachnospiraceae bacterium]